MMGAASSAHIRQVAGTRAIFDLYLSSQAVLTVSRQKSLVVSWLHAIVHQLRAMYYIFSVGGLLNVVWH